VRHIYSNIKLAIVITSFLLIAYAWIFQKTPIAIIGAILYLGAMLYDVIDLIVKSKKFKDGQDIEVAKSTSDKITTILEGILVIISLIAMAAENDLYRIPGQIIWFGQIAVFVLVGPIVEIFAGIPMKMTYGGWRVRKYQRRRR
jgi:hypothetical protein